MYKVQYIHCLYTSVSVSVRLGQWWRGRLACTAWCGAWWPSVTSADATASPPSGGARPVPPVGSRTSRESTAARPERHGSSATGAGTPEPAPPFSSSTHTWLKGRDAICSISTNSRCLLLYMSYFCLIFHKAAATSNKSRKHEEKVMKNCCKFNFGYWEKDICIHNGGRKS